MCEQSLIKKFGAHGISLSINIILFLIDYAILLNVFLSVLSLSRPPRVTKKHIKTDPTFNSYYFSVQR